MLQEKEKKDVATALQILNHQTNKTDFLEFNKDICSLILMCPILEKKWNQKPEH